MSFLKNLRRPSSAAYVENGHGSALRKGKVFRFDGQATALASAASQDLRFVTGVDAIILEFSEFSINQEDVTFLVYEDSTFTNGGVIIAPNPAVPMNRIIAADSQIQFYDTPVVNVIGTEVLHQQVLGSAGQNVNQPGFGAAGEAIEIVFKPNTEHVFRITNNSALAVDCEAHFVYREVNPEEYKANA